MNTLIKASPIRFHSAFTSLSAQNECNAINEIFSIILFSCCSLYGHVLYWQPAVQTYCKSSYSAFIGFSVVFITMIPYCFSEMIKLIFISPMWYEEVLSSLLIVRRIKTQTLKWKYSLNWVSKMRCLRLPFFDLLVIDWLIYSEHTFHERVRERWRAGHWDGISSACLLLPSSIGVCFWPLLEAE